MEIVGVAVPGGPTLFSCTLDHGVDPHLLVWQQGYTIQRMLAAHRVDGSDLVVNVQVVAHNRSVPETPPLTRLRGMDADLRLAPDETPLRRQRIAAYGIVLSERGLLATEFSPLTAVPGMWGLPGGGMDGPECPAHTVQREVVEETGQIVRIDQLLDLQTDHWVGRAPSGVAEDFHAVRLIYAATCEEPTDPRVHDIGGTTSDAAWVPPERWWSFHWSAGTRQLLERHLNALAKAS